MSDDIRKDNEYDKTAGERLQEQRPHSIEKIKMKHLVHKFRIKMKNEARVMASAAAKVSEDLSIKDAKILRLIEERRSTPKEEKQRLKELSIQRILEDFKGVRNIPGIKSAKKKVLNTKIKKRQR